MTRIWTILNSRWVVLLANACIPYEQGFDKFFLSPYISNHFVRIILFTSYFSWCVLLLLLLPFFVLLLRYNALRNTITYYTYAHIVIHTCHQSIRVSSSFRFKSNTQYPLPQCERSIRFVKSTRMNLAWPHETFTPKLRQWIVLVYFS